MTTGEPQPSTDTIGEKTLEAAQVVEKSIKAYEQLLLKCKDDWIHHLAQALAFSLLTALAPISILLLSIFSVILGKLDVQTQHLFAGRLEAVIPPPLSTQAVLMLSKTFDAFTHAPAIAS